MSNAKKQTYMNVTENFEQNKKVESKIMMWAKSIIFIEKQKHANKRYHNEDRQNEDV